MTLVKGLQSQRIAKYRIDFTKDKSYDSLEIFTMHVCSNKRNNSLYQT